LLQGGETSGTTRSRQNTIPEIALPDLDRQAAFATDACAAGADALLTDFGFAKPDPILLAAAVGARVPAARFIIAYRSGLIAPVSFVQLVNTLSTLLNGRCSLNIVAGHSPAEQRSYGDFLAHDDRYARTDEFLDICHRFWRSGGGPVNFTGRFYQVEGGRLHTPFVSNNGWPHPEIYIAGNSETARELAVRRGTCWMRLAGTPEEAAVAAAAVRPAGVELGLRLSVVAAPTRAEALRQARELVKQLGQDAPDQDQERRFIRNSDSVSMGTLYRAAGVTEWLTPTLWTGLVQTHGSASVALVGSAQEVADALLEYGRAGVSQFILSGWPKWDTVQFFGQEVLPRIRNREAPDSTTPRLKGRTNG
jgi:alkanesulfonate monooxygenase